MPPSTSSAAKAASKVSGGQEQEGTDSERVTDQELIHDIMNTPE